MTLDEKILELRKASGISQEQLAEQLNVSRQSVSKWELGNAVPDVSKIILLSELFSVTTDELLKKRINDVESTSKDNSRKSTLTIEEIMKSNIADKHITMGFVSVIIGLVMLVLEFLFLPLFGRMHKEQTNGDGYFIDFIRYSKVQPMPIIFTITFIIIIFGALFMLKGYKYKKKS
ncbi:MAG: helix-turn-helix transcriptional regulator [Clostridium sp.]|nr:helix-turn-helix transcriptional regulator [Clostridium sp.]